MFMFGHLKPGEFVDLIEGVDIPLGKRIHADHCERCFTTWKSMRAARQDLSLIDRDLIEPDWADFRSSVRDALLSRSAKRASAVRRWTGWPVRPVVAWALSVVAVAGVTAGAFMWNRTDAPATAPTPAVEAIADENTFIDAEMTVWSQTSVFEELSQLRTTEEEQFRALLQAADPGDTEQ